MKPYDKAYNLFFNTNLTQQQIAEQVGVSPRTIYDWMKNGNWKTLKATSRLMPAQIVDDIYNHISHLNYKIKSRDFEDRCPSRDEAETLRKLIFSVGKIKTQASKGEAAQSMMNFVSWLQTRNHDAAVYFSQFIDEYLHSPRKQGLEPYEFEYDADQYYNPTDFPNENKITFYEQNLNNRHPEPVSGPSDNTEAEPSAAGESSPPYLQGGVPAEPPAAPAGGGGSPLAQENQTDNLQNTSLSFGEGRGEAPLATDTSHHTSSPSQRPGEVPLVQENKQHVTPSPLVEKGPGDEVDKQKTGTKSEALSTSSNTTKQTENQSTNPNIPTQTTSETKKIEIGSSPQPEEKEVDVQAIFDSWKKIIEKERRRRRY